MELRGPGFPEEAFSPARLDRGGIAFSTLPFPVAPVRQYLEMPALKRDEFEKDVQNCVLLGWADAKTYNKLQHVFTIWADGYLLVRKLSFRELMADHSNYLFTPIAWARNCMSLANLVHSLIESDENVTQDVLEWVASEVTAPPFRDGEALVLYYAEHGGLMGIYDATRNVLCLPGIYPITDNPAITLVPPSGLEGLVHRLAREFPKVNKGTPPKRKINREGIRIGADIEAVVVDTDGIVHSPTEFVPDTQESQIGTDGNVELLEIRPEEGNTPAELAENTRMLLDNLTLLMPKGFDLYGGGGADFSSSIGLHIHFSGISTDVGRTSRGQEVDPAYLVKWLDALLSTVIVQLPGAARHGDRYGRFGDFRNKRNHSHFPHYGFEWRTLPSIIADRKLYEAVLKIAYCIMLTFEQEGIYKFNEKQFGADWYTGLVDADEYMGDILYFVEWVKGQTPVVGPVLRNWFGVGGEKDRECDTMVKFANDEDGYLAIVDFYAYNPAKSFDTIVLWASPSGKGMLISQPVPKLKEYVLSTYGLAVQIRSPSLALQKRYAAGRTLYIGIGVSVLNRMRANSVGSRNRIKMFVQDVIKHL